MTETTSSQIPEWYPAILELDDIARRYHIGKTKAQELVSQDGFPSSVVPGMHRYPLAALELWEVAKSLEGTIADPMRTAIVPAPPARGQVGRPQGQTTRKHHPRTTTSNGAR